jgi:hypothetical protein
MRTREEVGKKYDDDGERDTDKHTQLNKKTNKQKRSYRVVHSGVKKE